jgi:hypothetical protein
MTHSIDEEGKFEGKGELKGELKGDGKGEGKGEKGPKEKEKDLQGAISNALSNNTGINGKAPFSNIWDFYHLTPHPTLSHLPLVIPLSLLFRTENLSRRRNQNCLLNTRWDLLLSFLL